LENILHLNEGSSCEFTPEPAEEEKIEWYHVLAVGPMKGSFESELRHLLQIELRLVGLALS
jgi:hypothetical protein